MLISGVAWENTGRCVTPKKQGSHVKNEKRIRKPIQLSPPPVQKEAIEKTRADLMFWLLL